MRKKLALKFGQRANLVGERVLNIVGVKPLIAAMRA
jgi:hypothetical protein